MLEPKRLYRVWWYNRREAKTVRYPLGRVATARGSRYARSPRTSGYRSLSQPQEYREKPSKWRGSASKGR